MSKNKTATLVTAMFASSVLLSGCGLFTNQIKKIDPPKSVVVVDKKLNQNTTAKKENTQGMVKTELYLIDKNGYVVPKTLNLPKTNSIAKQALEYLVANGPVSEMLPNGFRAVIPADTSLSVNIKDGVATVDFSKEFKNYQPGDELKILQSVTWTLTQFDTIKQVKLQMNGQELTKMPVNGTPISGDLTRSIGINIDISGVNDLTNTKPVTLYYIGGEQGSYYYVPVTRRISSSEKDTVSAVVNELVQGPSEQSNLVTEFMPDVKLLESPKIENGKVTLDFNENIYGSFKKNTISQNLLDELVLSLTEQKDIKEVAVTVKGKAQLATEDGKKLTAPVTRPQKVNTGSF